MEINLDGHLLELALVPGKSMLPDFYLAKTLTTQALWRAVMGEDSSRFQYPGDEQPAEHVSWYDCQVFLRRLPGYPFRLPTEAEWEYAACYDGFRFAGTDDMNEAGWYEGNAGPFTGPEAIHRMRNADKKTTPHPVALKKPNSLGLYDLNGNVWEWCQDWRDGTRQKVLRGGCHHNWQEHCTNTKRYEISPDSSDGCIGFRIALSAG